MKEMISKIRICKPFRIRFPPITNANCFSGFIFSTLIEEHYNGINLGKMKIKFRSLYLHYLSKSDAEILQILASKAANLSA